MMGEIERPGKSRIVMDVAGFTNGMADGGTDRLADRQTDGPMDELPDRYGAN